MLGSSQWDNPKVYAPNNELLRGSYYPALNRARLDRFERSFNQSFGYNPPIIATLGYDTLLIIEDMIGSLRSKRAQTINTAIMQGKKYDNLVTGPLVINSDRSVSRFLDATRIK